MKKLFLCLSAALVCDMVSAQDIIVKLNGDELQAKVIEVGDTQIKYRKFSNPDGPLYSITSSEVFVVKFENGTREVITPALTEKLPAQADDAKYAAARQAAAEVKKPHRNKTFYFGPKAEYGFASITSSSDKGPSFSGTLVTGGVFGEWLPCRYCSSGVGLGVSYARYMFDEEFDLSHLNLDLYYAYRPKSHFAMKYGMRVGIPLSAKVGEVDVMDGCKTPVGLFADFLWSTKYTDLGGGLFYTFTDALDSGSESSKLLGISIQFALRF